ncbi:MAG TPA: xanthine dehydrogenase family protein subunit M [Alphaproteobacteria bacterium]|nr:xanthine dehydrogenase family protein subunit M [Alphaproteobacteria bacterium]
MYSPTYAAPTTVDEAVGLLANAAAGTARVLSGGTDLIVQMRSGRTRPELIVDIKRINGTIGIREEADGWHIGAATPGAMVGDHEKFSTEWPGISEAVQLIGSTQVQGRASFAGNLCNASPAGDSVPALVAAGAQAVICGKNGKRSVPVEQVPLSPGKTSLAADEFVYEFIVPRQTAKSADAYLRFIPRTEMDIAVVGCGVSLTLDGSGKCTAARVSLGAVAPTVLLVENAAEPLIGNTLDDATLEALDQAAQNACSPIDDKRGTIEYRIKVAGVLARRTAAIAFERAAAR